MQFNNNNQNFSVHEGLNYLSIYKTMGTRALLQLLFNDETRVSVYTWTKRAGFNLSHSSSSSKIPGIAYESAWRLSLCFSRIVHTCVCEYEIALESDRKRRYNIRTLHACPARANYLALARRNCPFYIRAWFSVVRHFLPFFLFPLFVDRARRLCTLRADIISINIFCFNIIYAGTILNSHGSHVSYLQTTDSTFITCHYGCIVF